MIQGIEKAAGVLDQASEYFSRPASVRNYAYTKPVWTAGGALAGAAAGGIGDYLLSSSEDRKKRSLLRKIAPYLLGAGVGAGAGSVGLDALRRAYRNSPEGREAAVIRKLTGQVAPAQLKRRTVVNDKGENEYAITRDQLLNNERGISFLDPQVSSDIGSKGYDWSVVHGKSGDPKKDYGIHALPKDNRRALVMSDEDHVYAVPDRFNMLHGQIPLDPEARGYQQLKWQAAPRGYYGDGYDDEWVPK